MIAIVAESQQLRHTRPTQSDASVRNHEGGIGAPYLSRGSITDAGIDPETGYCYETEDDGGNSGFYKYVPFEAGPSDMAATCTC